MTDMIRERAAALFAKYGEKCIDGLQWILDECNGAWPDVVNQALELTMPFDDKETNHQRAVLRILVPAALLAARAEGAKAERERCAELGCALKNSIWYEGWITPERSERIDAMIEYIRNPPAESAKKEPK